MSKKYTWSAAAALAAFAAIVIGCATGIRARSQESTALPAASWGLSLQTEGQPPVGNVSQSVLDGYDAAFLGDTTQPVIYLTFDAGYENGYTEKILDVLKTHEAPAAFFVVGNYVEQNPELVRRMVADGHIVGNHTYHHKDMPSISDEAAFAQELTSLEELYYETTGEQMSKYYRPPRGEYSEENLKQAQKLGYKTVFWSLAYVDWYQDDQPSAEEAFSKLIPRIHNGAVVLLHSTSSTNAEILDELLRKWEDMGYRFGTLEELFSGSAESR